MGPEAAAEGEAEGEAAVAEGEGGVAVGCFIFSSKRCAKGVNPRANSSSASDLGGGGLKEAGGALQPADSSTTRSEAASRSQKERRLCGGYLMVVRDSLETGATAVILVATQHHTHQFTARCGLWKWAV